jgi:hypothetical protein
MPSNPSEGGYATARPCNGKELDAVNGPYPLPYRDLFLGRLLVVKRHTNPRSGFLAFSRGVVPE